MWTRFKWDFWYTLMLAWSVLFLVSHPHPIASHSSWASVFDLGLPCIWVFLGGWSSNLKPSDVQARVCTSPPPIWIHGIYFLPLRLHSSQAEQESTILAATSHILGTYEEPFVGSGCMHRRLQGLPCVTCYVEPLHWGIIPLSGMRVVRTASDRSPL